MVHYLVQTAQGYFLMDFHQALRKFLFLQKNDFYSKALFFGKTLLRIQHGKP